MDHIYADKIQEKDRGILQHESVAGINIFKQEELSNGIYGCIKEPLFM